MSDNIFPVTMPKWGMEMTEGKIAVWLVEEGDAVSKGDDIVEVETDKIVNTCEAAYEGVLRRRLIEEDETKPVGALLAVIAAAEATDAEIDAFIENYMPAGTAGEQAEKKEPAPAAPAKAVAPAAPAPAAAANVATSPMAKRYAAQHGIDLSTVKGTGRGGRISLDDVKAAEAGGAEAPDEPEAPATDDTENDGYRAEKLSSMRKTIARRLNEAKSTIPHFYLNIEVRMGALLAERAAYNGKSDQKASINDFLIRAMALALHEIPEANVQFTAEELRFFDKADVSVAVAIDGGLVTPIVRDAGGKSLGEIAAAMLDLAERAKTKKLAMEDMVGGTISLSNLGMYGIQSFDAVINPPQAAIIAVGAVEERPANVDGELALHPMMSATMSCDHRAIDGALGARYLAAFKALLEDPKKLTA